MDTSHLTAIHERLWREKARLANARSKKEKALRQVCVNQAEKELAREMEFLGIEKTKEEMSDEELMKALEEN